MTNSDIDSRAEAIVDEIFFLLGDEFVQKKVCDPIEKAASNFTCPATGSVAPSDVIRVAGDFIRHVMKHAFGIHLRVNQAEAKALELLEMGYQGAYNRGYHAACLDAGQQREMAMVLSSLVRMIVSDSRRKHTQWVFATRIDSRDWELQKAISRVLFQRWKHIFPPDLASFTPCELASYIQEMIQVILLSDQMVSEIVSAELD